MSALYLGIDGGGATTHAIITDEHGQRLGYGRSGGANPHNMPVGHALMHIELAISDAIKDAKTFRNLDDQDIVFESACLGLSGIDTQRDRDYVTDAINALPKRSKTFGAKQLILVNDGLITLYAGNDSGQGISLVAATGANCYGISHDGKEAIAGDWGFVLGDQGSSYAMGRAILRQVVKEYDGRRRPTKLTPAVLKFLGFTDVPELVSWVYQGDEVPVREIAELPKIFDNPDLRDVTEIKGILLAGVRELAEAFEAVATKMSFDYKNDSFPVVLAGGLFLMRGEFASQVKEYLLNVAPNADVMFPEQRAVEGAAKYARIWPTLEHLPETGVIFKSD